MNINADLHKGDVSTRERDVFEISKPEILNTEEIIEVAQTGLLHTSNIISSDKEHKGNKINSSHGVLRASSINTS